MSGLLPIGPVGEGLAVAWLVEGDDETDDPEQAVNAVNTKESNDRRITERKRATISYPSRHRDL